ncbi:uncharacterized protein LOC132717669 [Ruditapes philippinarum]|uniref:uncharacterized protein LOC132717669 n=1 Tax=Ruditapes philippinarum TaxID=129788 RepID=UPI00295B99DB|nr:uncharacterized protein LOC132717669 [Ruditapes philippinarum]
MFSVKLLAAHFFICSLKKGVFSGSETPRKLQFVRFLVTVNDTWADPPGCISTIATPVVPVNKSENLQVGECDHGPIEYTFYTPGKNYNKYTVSLIFHSSVIEDASPPTCDLSWNGTYLVPKSPVKENPDLLPSCFVQDSREGYHMTSYWFHLLDWSFE